MGTFAASSGSFARRMRAICGPTPTSGASGWPAYGGRVRRGSADRLRCPDSEGGDTRRPGRTALAPDGVDVAGNGVLSELIALAGGEPRNVITLADFAGTEEHGVHFSNRFADGNAFHALDAIGELIEAGRFWLVP